MRFLPRFLMLASLIAIPASLLALALPASADDILPPAPTMTSPTINAPAPPITNPTPAYTYPAPMGTTGGNGMIIHGDAPIISGSAAPMMEYNAPIVEQAPVVEYHGGGAINGSGYIAGSYNTYAASTFDQFNNSSYWTAPQPFNPGGAPNYSYGPASRGGVHVRYPYFSYRSPWTYQGPAALSHTIEW